MAENIAENIHVKLPDGSVKDVPRGTSALEIAKSISPRLADAALAAQIKPLSPNGSGGNGHKAATEAAPPSAEPAKNNAQLVDLDPSAGAGCRAAHPHRPRPRGAGSLSPLVGALDGRGSAGAFPRDQAWPRASHRERLLLRSSIARSPSRLRTWRPSRRKCRN